MFSYLTIVKMEKVEGWKGVKVERWKGWKGGADR